MAASALDIELTPRDTRLSDHVRDTFGAYVGGVDAVRLNLGCGRTLEPGFTNLDRVGDAGADVAFDLEHCANGPLPFADAMFDCVLASHVLEHIRELIPVMREIHRILKPGGHLCLVSPYASSDDAWEDPTHVRAFTEMTWHYFDRALYEKKGHAGSYPSEIDFRFTVTNVGLVPFPDLQLSGLDLVQRQAELAVKKRFMRNVIKEMQAVLTKVEG